MYQLLCAGLQTGQGALQALVPTSDASMVKYGTSASSLTQTATGSAEVSLKAHLLSLIHRHTAIVPCV